MVHNYLQQKILRVRKNVIFNVPVGSWRPPLHDRARNLGHIVIGELDVVGADVSLVDPPVDEAVRVAAGIIPKLLASLAKPGEDVSAGTLITSLFIFCLGIFVVGITLPLVLSFSPSLRSCRCGLNLSFQIVDMPSEKNYSLTKI